MALRAVLKVYVAAVIVAGLGLLFFLFSPVVLEKHWFGVLFFIVLAMLAESMPVYLPRDIIVSVGFCVFYASILIFGPGVGSLVAAMGALVGNRPQTPWYQILFNFSQLALSAGLAGLVFLWAGGEAGNVRVVDDAIPIVMGAAACFLFNSSLTTIAAGLAQNINPFTIWLSRIGGVLVNFLVLIPLGVLTATLYLRDGIAGVLLLVIPLAAARFSFKQYTNMRNLYLQTIQAIAAAVDAKDPYTKGHSERVRAMSVAIARELKVPDQEQELIEYMALLHDTGKIGISESILNKPAMLTGSEYETVQEHPAIGARIVGAIDFFRDASNIVRYHHEWFNGTGYPEGLQGEAIPQGARIIAVADAFDAMTSQRPYRAAMSRKNALREIRGKAGQQFDPVVVEAFLRIMAREGEFPD